jgi:hypothetical protein
MDTPIMRSPGFRSKQTDVATETGSLRGTHRRPTHVPQQQITGWVLRTARLRAPATQPIKGVARDGRGTSCGGS